MTWSHEVQRILEALSHGSLNIETLVFILESLLYFLKTCVSDMMLSDLLI